MVEYIIRDITQNDGLDDFHRSMISRTVTDVMFHAFGDRAMLIVELDDGPHRILTSNVIDSKTNGDDTMEIVTENSVYILEYSVK